MAAARTPPTPAAPDRPFWRHPVFGIAVSSAAAALLFFLTLWLQGENERRAQQRMIEDNPRLRDLTAGLRSMIDSRAEMAGIKAPAALWIGRISEYKESSAIDGSPPIAIVALSRPALLAGTSAPKDSPNRVEIAGDPAIFQGPAPVKGETWIIAVRRDSEGRNSLHTAVRASQPNR